MYRLGKTFFAGIVAMALVGCGTTTRTSVLVPASELPYLGKTTTGEVDTLPVATALDGFPHEFKGPIDSVQLMTKKRLVDVDVPFTARIDGDQLTVSTDQARTYKMQDITYATVSYGFDDTTKHRGRPSSQRRMVGLALGLGAIIPLTLGITTMASECDTSAPFDLCGLQPVVGGFFFFLAGGLVLTGVIVGNTGSRPPPTQATIIRPTLRLSPNGGAFAFEF